MHDPILAEGLAVPPRRHDHGKHVLRRCVAGQEFERPPPYRDLQDLQDLCDLKEGPVGQEDQEAEDLSLKSVARRAPGNTS